MSANIRSGKMNLAVFGRGYDDTRADSGDGTIEDYYRLALGASSACFDVTGQYLWVGCEGNGHTPGLLKFDANDDFNEVVHTVPTGTVETVILHASNVANNYGLVTQGNNWWVFDMTSEAVIASGSDATLGANILYTDTPYDCVLDGTKFFITKFYTSNQVSPKVIAFDYSNGTTTVTTISANRSGGAFINERLIYQYYASIWFYQNRYIEATTPNNIQAWGRMAPEGGSDGFKNVSLSGFGKNGKLYCPSNVYSAWRIGEYNGTRTPNFDTPRPIRVFGKFEDEPIIKTFAFSHEKTAVTFSTPIGCFVSDFEDVQKISDTFWEVFAISDTHAVIEAGRVDSGHLYSLGIFKYR